MTRSNIAQIIRASDGAPAYAVLRWEDFAALDPDGARSALSDEALYDEATAATETTLPAEVVGRLRRGDHPVKVFREHKGLTQAQLADKVKINTAYLSQIETGVRQPSHQLLADLARALGVDYDMLVGDDLPLPEPLVVRPLSKRMVRLSTVGQAHEWAVEERDRFTGEDGNPLPGHEAAYRRFHDMQALLHDALVRMDPGAVETLFPDLKALAEG